MASVASDDSSFESNQAKEDESREKEYLLSTHQSSITVSTEPGNNYSSGGKLKTFIIFSALWLAYLIISAAYSIISPFYPQEAQNYGVGSLGVGLIVGASPLCVVILSPILGYYIPQLGLKFLLISGCLLVGGSFLLMGFLIEMPSNFEFILFSVLLRVVEGSGSAGYSTSLFTIATILYPSSTGTVMGILEVGSGIGFVAGPPLGGLLYNIGGFKLPFIVTGGLVLLFVPLFLLMIPNAPGKKQVIPPKTLLKLLQNVPFVMLCLDNVIMIAALGFFTPTLAPFLKEQFHLSEVHIGMVFLCGPLLYMVSSFVAGKFSDILGPRYLIVSGFIVTGVSYFFIGPATFISSQSYLWLTCVAFGVLGTGLGFGIVPIYPDMLGIAKNIDKDTSKDTMIGIISGLSSSTLCFGEFIGPIVGGALTQILTFKLSAMIFGEVLIAKGFILLGITLINRFFNRYWSRHHQHNNVTSTDAGSVNP